MKMNITLTQIMEKLNKIEEMLSIQSEKPLSLEEASVYLHVSKSYMYKLTHRRQIPCFKPNGKKVYFKKSDLESWLFRIRQATDEELDAEAEARLKQMKH